MPYGLDGNARHSFEFLLNYIYLYNGIILLPSYKNRFVTSRKYIWTSSFI